MDKSLQITQHREKTVEETGARDFWPTLGAQSIRVRGMQLDSLLLVFLISLLQDRFTAPRLDWNQGERYNHRY